MMLKKENKKTLNIGILLNFNLRFLAYIFSFENKY
jgi:hypothetical protein